MKKELAATELRLLREIPHYILNEDQTGFICSACGKEQSSYSCRPSEHEANDCPVKELEELYEMADAMLKEREK